MPAGAVRALDAGCGQGVLTRELREKVPSVTGIDLHGPSLELARSHSDDIDYIVGDALTYRCEPGSFEVERLWRKEWVHNSPVVWPLPMTRDECRAVSQRALPGATFTRRMWLRYTLIWRKPI